MTEQIHWYRYEDVSYAPPYDPETEKHWGPGRTDIVKRSYPVMKITPKGVWISQYGTKRFILADSRKRFAHATVEEAMDSFMARKHAQLRILQSQVSRIQRAIQLGHQMIMKHVETKNPKGSSTNVADQDHSSTSGAGTLPLGGFGTAVGRF